MCDTGDDILRERYDLAMSRIRQIGEENDIPEPFRDYFASVAGFIMLMDDEREALQTGQAASRTLAQRRTENERMYQDILPGRYATSYANPAWAAGKLGDGMGPLLSFVYSQIRGIIAYIYEGMMEETVIHLELFLEILGCFTSGEMPAEKQIRDIIYWFASDYCDVLVAERVRRRVDPARDFAVRIVMESNLEESGYLFDYGEYVTDNEIALAGYLASLEEERIDEMARTFCEGYRVGFVKAGIDLSKKLTVDIHYHLGFERVVRRAVALFEEMGLRPVIYRYALSAVNKRGAARIGYTGAVANRQYEYDHREDMALFLDRRFMERKLAVMKHTYETFKTLANAHAGPAVIETFGETPFVPENVPGAITLSERQQALLVELNNEAAVLTNQYIIGKESSFTIISFPVPEIGERFEEIFAETMAVNTLDAALYERIQQTMIDVLDKGERVHILGAGENRTDLTVALQPLADPFRETLFENCVADVNIPVGEVFTTPLLKGTNGLLHVTQVYLNGLDYRDLRLTFKDGMVADYACGNFEDEAQGKAYIKANVLYHHETLPMGEFAIGTNTTAYMMARRFHIGALLPILIAEKTGPHFAVGDTCYSWSEEVAVFNPDGRECVARDNAVSILRKEDPGKAYFGCHTDITIPYEELGLIEVIDGEGHAAVIIRDGRFVLPGTEELNKALDV